MSLRKCKHCGIEAIIKEDLKLFRTSTASKYGKCNLCKECYSNKQKVRRNIHKYKAIIYLGGSCDHCDVEATKENIAIFDFHHLDKHKKDFEVSAKNTFDSVKEELDKCQLLCSNCHRIVHFKEGY